MNPKTRIYNEVTNINADDVKNFYEKKASANLLNAVFLNDKLPSTAHNLRNQKEKEALCSFLENKKYKILEIGCAAGRWVDNLVDKYIDKYDGIDFCANFISAANEKFKDFSNINFYQMSVSNLNLNVLDESYDLIIICGISMYINDDELLQLYKTIDKFLLQGAKLYVQESVSIINQRLTLKNFYSDELKENYSAIYRTPEEYTDFIKSSINNLNLVKKEFILTENTGARKETNSCCFCFDCL